MAAKGIFTGKKRKATETGKVAAAEPPKKARFEPDDEDSEDVEMSADEFSGLSDSEDGGAPLESNPPKKSQSGKTNGNATNGANGAKKNVSEKDKSMSSREAHAAQRQVARERKAAKPLADEVMRAKKIWERLRIKSKVPKEERQQLTNELFSIMDGRMKDFVLKHDSVRAVQTAIKYGSAEQRKKIAKELKGSYAQLAESRYAKFLIGKLMAQGDEEIRDMIVPEFYGRVKRLINHPEGSWILDDIYRVVATKEQKAVMLREWYGPNVSLLDSDTGKTPNSDLAEILEDDSSKRGPTMKFLLDMIDPLVQKRMTGFTMLHDAMLQYFLNLKKDSEDYTEFFELVKGDETGDLLKNLAFTKSGSRLVCLLLAHGSAKDRKQILKTYKDTITLMSGDQYGHLVLLVAFDVIDDTVMAGKAIFPELLGQGNALVSSVVALANNMNARLCVLYLLEGTSRSIFQASHAYDLEVLDEVHEIRKSSSKKNSEQRRKELVETIAPQLLTVIESAAADLMASAFGCQFVGDVLFDVEGDKANALEAVASVAEGDTKGPTADAEVEVEGRPSHISQTSWGGRLLKSLIAGGRFDKKNKQIKQVDPPLKFADILYPKIKDHVMGWATGPSSFVVLGLAESADFSHQGELRATLRQGKEALRKAASEETPEQIASREAREAEADKAKGGKKAKKGGERNVGNMGSKLLLEKL